MSSLQQIHIVPSIKINWNMDPTSTQTVMKRQLVLCFSLISWFLSETFEAGRKKMHGKPRVRHPPFGLQVTISSFMRRASFAKCFGKRNESEYPWELFMIILFKSSWVNFYAPRQLWIKSKLGRNLRRREEFSNSNLWFVCHRPIAEWFAMRGNFELNPQSPSSGIQNLMISLNFGNLRRDGERKAIIKVGNYCRLCEETKETFW